MWLLGLPLAQVAEDQEADVLQFVENGLVYRLPWAMEAIRVRGLANGDVVGEPGMTLDDFEVGLAVSAVETGTINSSASILIRAGFNSRLAAVKVIDDTGGAFANAFELHQWLLSDRVIALSAQPDWPTAETKSLWTSFVESFAPRAGSTWSEQQFQIDVYWRDGAQPPPRSPIRLLSDDGRSIVLSADGLTLGRIDAGLNPKRRGLLRAAVMDEPNKILLSYLGPEDLWLP